VRSLVFIGLVRAENHRPTDTGEAVNVSDDEFNGMQMRLPISEDQETTAVSEGENNGTTK